MDNFWNQTFLMPQAPFGAQYQQYANPASPYAQPQQQMDAYPMLPPTLPPAPQLRKYAAADWEEHKDEITRLHDVEKKKLPEIQAFMKQNHGLTASDKQYKDRFKKWKLNKNIKKDEWRAITRKLDNRSRIGKASAVRVRKQEISQPKIERYINDQRKRNELAVEIAIEGDVEMKTGEINDHAATPSDISVYTPRPVDPQTPWVAQSPRDIVHAYDATISMYGNSPGQFSNPEPMFTDSPFNPVNLAPSSNIATPQLLDHNIPMRDGTPVAHSPWPQSPASPASSISSIVRPQTSTFTGQSPAFSGSAPDDEPSQPPTTPLNKRYKYDEEDKMLRELSEAEYLYGETNVNTLEKWLDLANLRRDQGRYKSAEEIIRKVLAAYPEDSEGENVEKLVAQYRLAEILGYQGFYKKAERILQRIIPSQELILGAEDPDTLASKYQMACRLRQLGKFSQAEKLEKQVLEVKRRVFGEESIDTLISMSNLASIYRRQGRWSEAEKLELEVLEVTKRVLGDKHPNTLTSMSNLALTYWNQGRWSEAEKLELEVLEVTKKVLGEGHPDTLTSMSNLASIYWNQGRWSEAEKLELEVLEVTKRVLGERHPDTLTSMSNLASTYRNQGRWSEAEKLELEVLEVTKKVLGEGHPDTLTSMGNLASTYWNQGRLEEAEELEVDLLETRKKVLGQEHPNTVLSMSNLAHTWWRQGRYVKAVELLASCVNLSIKVLGRGHPDTKSRVGWLDEWKSVVPSVVMEGGNAHVEDEGTG